MKLRISKREFSDDHTRNKEKNRRFAGRLTMRIAEEAGGWGVGSVRTAVCSVRCLENV